MCFDSFYISRKGMIDKRLEEIKETSVEVHVHEKLCTDEFNTSLRLINSFNYSVVDKGPSFSRQILNYSVEQKFKILNKKGHRISKLTKTE